MVAMLLNVVMPLAVVAAVAAHGLMTDPCQRGALRSNYRLTKALTIDRNAPQDFWPHFPAGDKSRGVGSGKNFQRKAGGYRYSPFQPFDRRFNWRAGVCGDRDDVWPQDHLKGGKYYYNGKIVREYVAGSVVDFKSTIVAHHNGFFEFFICNLDSCPDGDISPRCFQQGHCRQLMRARNYMCDYGGSYDCGPIDRNYPGRWYLPCSRARTDVFGGSRGSMRYKIPNDLTCKHCVVLWYWASSNTCQAVGVREYFTGPDRPRWGRCRGQGGAIGGYVRRQRSCGGSLFSEEYYQCADVAVRGRGSRRNVQVNRIGTKTLQFSKPRRSRKLPRKSKPRRRFRKSKPRRRSRKPKPRRRSRKSKLKRRFRKSKLVRSRRRSRKRSKLRLRKHSRKRSRQRARRRSRKSKKSRSRRRLRMLKARRRRRRSRRS